MCTLKPLEHRLRNTHAVAFIGTVDADTLLAGPGTKRYIIDQGHYGRGNRRTIYGQSARLERAERAATPALRDAVATDSFVVLVPWDYSASCEPVPWTQSARWLAPGTRGVFVGELRDRNQWVDNRPTFDVTPAAAVYPPPWSNYRGERWATVGTLSADEFLSLYEVLPDGRSLQATPDSAVAPLLRWATAFPELAAKEPAAHLLRRLRRDVVEARYENQVSPLAGTYRVVYRTAAGDSSLFFARTELHPNSVIRSKDPQAADLGDVSGPPIVGHYLLALVAKTISELPRRRVGSGELEGYFALVDRAVETNADTSIFLGSIDLESEAALLAPDSLGRRRLEEAGRQKAAVRTAMFRRNKPGTPGRFVMTRGGDARFEMLIQKDGLSVLTVQAERISREHLEVRRP
jgi:hypothetical protein